MNNRSQELLKKMAAVCDETKKNSFDKVFYLEYPQAVIDELELHGYIIKTNDILGSIELTKSGYIMAHK